MIATAYNKGQKAWKDEGESGEGSCPYPSGGSSNSGTSDRRTQWFNGYFDARTDDRLGRIFRKYGLTTMTEDSFRGS